MSRELTKTQMIWPKIRTSEKVNCEMLIYVNNNLFYLKQMWQINTVNWIFTYIYVWFLRFFLSWNINAVELWAAKIDSHVICGTLTCVKIEKMIFQLKTGIEFIIYSEFTAATRWWHLSFPWHLSFFSVERVESWKSKTNHNNKRM